MDNVQIEIQDSDNSILGVLEVGNVKNFGLALTTSISDLRDITKRSGSFALTFKVPSTKSNDELLDHIYLSDQKNYKDFDAEKDCIIRVNGLDIESGLLQITKMNSLGRAQTVSYSFKFFGNNMGWVNKMVGFKTKDLPYLNKTLVYDDPSVQASWVMTGGAEEPVYSFINRGERINPNQVGVEDLRADYFALDYLESAFALVGYNFESTFFNTTANKNLMIPLFGKNWKIAQTTIDDDLVDVNLDGNPVNINLNIPNVANGLVYRIRQPLINNCSAVTINAPNTFYECSSQSVIGTYTEVKDDNNNFATGVFTAPQDGFYVVDGFFETSYFYDITKPEQIAGNLSRLVIHEIIINGTLSNTFNTASSGVVPTVLIGNQQEIRETFSRTTNAIFLSSGDTLTVQGTLQLVNNGPIASSTLQAKFKHWGTTNYTVTLQQDMQEGDSFNWADKSDDVVDVFDIVMDVFRIFNCYIRTNTANRTVYAEPRDDFYNALSTATNKTNTIDSNIQLQLEYNSKTYTENHLYDYVTDSNDAYLNKRNEEADNNWLSNEHIFPDKFKDGVTPYKTKVIAATYTIEDTFMSVGLNPTITGGGVTDGAYTSRLWNDADNMPLHSDDFAPRLLYFDYRSQEEGSLHHLLNYRGQAIEDIPFALPFSIYLSSSSLGYADVDGNLSFKDVQRPLGGALDAGLWQTNFSKTSQEIEEGKRLRINLLFDLADWVSFDFRNIIYFDNRYPEIEGYWRVERINGYKPTSTAISVPFDLVQARTFPVATSGAVEDPEDPRSGRYGLRLGGGGINRESTRQENTPTIVHGRDNYTTDNGNIIMGRNLRGTGENKLVYGMYNADRTTDVSTDLSTDLLHFGVGTDGNERSLIRVDKDGNVFFNDELQGNGSVLEISTDTTATLGIHTYLVNTISSDVTLTLPTPITPVGKLWNVKKLKAPNAMIITPQLNALHPVLIEDVSSVSEITQYTSLTPQFDGQNFYII